MCSSGSARLLANRKMGVSIVTQYKVCLKPFERIHAVFVKHISSSPFVDCRLRQVAASSWSACAADHRWWRRHVQHAVSDIGINEGLHAYSAYSLKEILCRAGK